MLLSVLDAVSTVNVRPFEPHLLTVSGARHFEDPEGSQSDADSAEVTEDENCPPTDIRPWVVIRDFSIKLWDVSTNGCL